MSIKIIIGIAIILASFVYILKRPDKSMMDSLMEKRNAQMQEASEQAEAAAEAESAVKMPAGPAAAEDEDSGESLPGCQPSEASVKSCGENTGADSEVSSESEF